MLGTSRDYWYLRCGFGRQTSLVRRPRANHKAARITRVLFRLALQAHRTEAVACRQLSHM